MTYVELGQQRRQQDQRRQQNQRRQPNQPQQIREHPQEFINLKAERKEIEAFVTKHYDRDNRALNLSHLNAFLPKVKSINFNDKRFAILLESILAVSCPDILSLGLDKNNISKLGAVSYLLHNRLQIINVSLDSNAISNFDELSVLKDVNLRELVLSHNPICSGKDDLTYQMEVVRRLPELFMLDQRQVKQEDNHPHMQLPPIRDSYFDTENIQNLSFGFLKKYYDAFDGDRESLLGAYDEHAQFSVTHIPTSQPKGHPQASSFRRDMFSAYTPLDRNLITNKATDKRAATLKAGRTHIVGILLDLPTTKHDYPSFTCDSFVTNIGVEMWTVSVHGDFTESNKKKRSFSRVFLLVPAPTPDKHEGWPFVIINDQFYIRHFVPKRPKPTQPQIPEPEVHATTTTTSAPASPPPPTEEEMMQLITRLATATKLLLPFCRECLEKNHWNFERSMIDFNALMANNTIPANWFASAN